MVKLIYPTVDVFIYDLRKTLLDTDTQIQARRERFLQKAYQGEILKQKITELAQSENDNTDYLELIRETFERDLDGYYYALQFSDGYSLQVNYSGEKKAETIQNQPVALEKIPNYKKIIVEPIKNYFFIVGDFF